MLVEAQEFLLEGFNLLAVQLCQQQLYALLSALQIIKLNAQLSVLLEVLLVPLLTVTTFLGDSVKLDISLMDPLL